MYFSEEIFFQDPKNRFAIGPRYTKLVFTCINLHDHVMETLHFNVYVLIY